MPEEPIEFRVWWIPQVPMPSFKVDVPDIATGKILCSALADYDLFQFQHNVKPDYANAGGMSWKHEVLTEGEWWDFDPDDEDDVEEIEGEIQRLEDEEEAEHEKWDENQDACPREPYGPKE